MIIENNKKISKKYRGAFGALVVRKNDRYE